MASRSSNLPADRRWALIGSAAFALSMAVYLVVWLREGVPGMIDLEVYRWAGDTARAGTGLYGSSFHGFLPFTYTPFAAFVFLALPSLPMSVLRVLALAVGCASVLLVAWVAIGPTGSGSRSSRPSPAGLDLRRVGLTLLVAAIGLQLEPVRQTLEFGQVNLVLLAIVVVDLCLPDSNRLKGIGVGIAAGFKLTPAIFIVYLLITRRWRAAATSMVTAVATVLLGAVVLPHESQDFWIGHLFADSRRVGGVGYVANQSIYGAVVRWSGGLPHVTPLLWVALVLVTTVAGLATAAALSRRGAELAAICTCALVGLLVSPVSWSHHWVWVIPGLALLVRSAASAASAGGSSIGASTGSTAGQPAGWPTVRWAAAGGALILALVFSSRSPSPGLIWQVPHRGDAELVWSIGQSVLGNLYVLAGVAALAAVVVHERPWRVLRAGSPIRTPVRSAR